MNERKSLLDNPLHLKSHIDQWFGYIDSQERDIINFHFGLESDDSLTLEEIGSMLGNITRERVRQIEKRALKKLGSGRLSRYWQPLKQLILQGITQNGGLLTSARWKHHLEENVVWNEPELQPALLPFVCAVFDDLHYIGKYDVATFRHVTRRHVQTVFEVTVQVLRKDAGEMTPFMMAQAVIEELPAYLPIDVKKSQFILSVAKLGGRIGVTPKGTHFFRRKKKISRSPNRKAGWAGNPGSRMHGWELNLRERFENIAWIGQLSISENDFQDMCAAIHEEARGKNHFSKKVKTQPRLVPPALFVTTMVFAARYAQEDADFFWTPYLRSVWKQAYTQAFMTRCRNRFKQVIPYLEETFKLEFPRKTEGEVVNAIYRHALLPSYLQQDFALWLQSKWRKILEVADTPDLLVSQLRQDSSLDHHRTRLKRFVTEPKTAPTAAVLITNMASAISLHINDDESVENIANLLSDTPIERELWEEIAKIFSITDENIKIQRTQKPRIKWIWNVDEGEIALRIQNLVIMPDDSLKGEPDRIVWLASSEDDPLTAQIEAEVTPWRMESGEWLIPDLLVEEPDGPPGGVIVLLTDYDEPIIQLEVPFFPWNASFQFFRATQQGAFGIPVQPSQINDGDWYVCAKQPLTFTDHNGEKAALDERFPVPYPIDEQFSWGGQIAISLPVTVNQGEKEVIQLAETTDNQSIGHPILQGPGMIKGLSRHVPPVFTNSDITLTIKQGEDRLLKQATLSIKGKDGYKIRQSLRAMREFGKVKLSGEILHLKLGSMLPKDKANYYTIELFHSLNPILPAPLEFAIVPHLRIENYPDLETLHTPANPPSAILLGLNKNSIVQRNGMEVRELGNQRHEIIWTNLRQDPHLIIRLRDGKIDIPLAWATKRFMVWIEPKPEKPFLTLDEIRQSTLHAVGRRLENRNFSLLTNEQQKRWVPLDRRGRVKAKIGHNQIFEILRRSRKKNTPLKIEIESQIWTLVEVRQRPQLTKIRTGYDSQEKLIIFETQLKELWSGQVQFSVESLTNPFAKSIVVNHDTALRDLHIFAGDLPAGQYHLRVELDGSEITLNKERTCFKVGQVYEEDILDLQLVREIRQGSLISSNLAEDFVVKLAELAEVGENNLSPTLRYQLATISAEHLENFQTAHLNMLWPLLAEVQKIQDTKKWVASNGLLPAWIFLDKPLTLVTERKNKLRVFPVQVAQGGSRGKGYARLRLSMDAGAVKTPVLIQWKPTNFRQKVLVEGGIPARDFSNNWAALKAEDIYGLKYCTKCGRLTGAPTYILPKNFEIDHYHGGQQSNLREINIPSNFKNGYDLLTEVIPERRGVSLINTFDLYGIPLTTTESILPESKSHSARKELYIHLDRLVRELLRLGSSYETRWPLWGSAARLLDVWRNLDQVSSLGQTSFALGVALRTAAYQPRLFYKLIREANLSELDIQTQLAHLFQEAPDFLRWGVIWAELLRLHSFSDFSYVSQLRREK